MKTRIKNFFPSLTFSSPFLTFLFPLLLTFLTLFAASIASAQIPSTGLVGYWPFNGNANDESGNGNNGTVNGATLTTDRFGNANSAYNFNGAGNLISLQGGSNIQGNNPRSISFWANMPSGITNTHTVYKGGVNGSGNDFTIWLVVLSDNTYRLQVRRYQNDPVTIQMPVVANQWINFCVTYDGTINSNVKIYINGVQQPGVSTNGGDNLIFNTISTTPEFGHMVDQLGVHRYMNGKLDDISIYNRALTPSEITQLYTDQTSTVATPPCPTLATNLQTGLVGYWPFCGNANDESGNGHHAINSGATLSTDRFGNINSSYSFNGQSYMTVPDIASAGNSPRTFSVWAYFNSVSYTEFSNYMISTGTPAQSSAFNLRLYLGKLNIMGFDNDYQNESGALVSSMAWHHCLIAYDGMNLMFYLDGQLQGSVTASFSTNGQTNYFGKSNHVGNELFLNGQMDDIGIWNRALTPTEITQLYTDPSTSPPVACTTFLGEDQTFCAGGNVTLSSNFSSCSGLTIPSTWNYVGSYGFSTYYIDPTSKNIPNWLSYLTSISPNAQLVCVETPGESQFLYTALLSYFSSHSSFTPWCGAFQNTSSPSFSEPSGGWQWYNGGQWGNLPWAQTQPDNYQGVQQNARLDYGSQPYLAMDDIESSYTTGALIEISCPYSILWSTGATTATINVTPTTTTTFTCTVTDANGNVCIDSVTVFVPQIEATDLTICAGETTTLSVSGINSTATPSACPTLPTNLQTGLVGYWPFCGNANDASGNGNSGTVNGATLTTDRFGSANNAYSFSTIDQNFIAVSQNGMSNDSGTYVAWINFDGPIAEGNPNLFLDWYTVIDPLMLNSNSNSSNYRKLLFNLNNQPTSSENLTFYDWHQIAVTVEPNANVTFFIDGINCGSQSITNSYSLVSFSNLFLIGKSSNNAWYWNGKIDDITIYNRALSPSEIQQLYTLGQTTYLWSNGATTPTINVSPSTTTTYTCTITTNGVSCTDSVTVVVSNPVIDLGADVTICGNSTTLTAPSGYDSYSWSNGATTNTTTVTANGTYSCTVIQGGCSATDAVDVTLVNATVSASDSTICAGQSVTLSVPQGGSTSTACAALPTNLQTGLVGYWPFCGNANDASGNGNNGTVNGATFTSDRFGNAGNALAFFDQYDRVVLNNVSLNSVSNYTVSIWYNKVPGSGGGSLYCSSNVYSTDGLRMGLDGNNLAAFGAEYLAGSVWSYSNQNATVNSQWHLFTAVLESTPGQVITSNNLKIYIDGNYQSTYQMAWGNPSAVYSPVSNNGLLSLIGNETWGSHVLQCTNTFHSH